MYSQVSINRDITFVFLVCIIQKQLAVELACLINNSRSFKDLTFKKQLVLPLRYNTQSVSINM